MARIAVVDDNPSARLFALACLNKCGHEAQDLEPTCLFAVLEALHLNPPDLLITGMVMSGCPGMTLIRACREDVHLKQLKILLLTAHGDRRLARFLRNLDNIHYLSKPVGVQEFSDCVEAFLTGNLEVDLGWSLDCQGLVAVVDDSQLSRFFHSKILRLNGFKPLEIIPDNLTHVIRTLEQAKPDALLLDFLMPNFRGDALIRALRASGVARLRELPVLMITAHHPEDITGLGSQAEHVDVLFKPLYPEELIAKVQELLRARAGA
jgi:DNA-binding response OmpR family regulator